MALWKRSKKGCDSSSTDTWYTDVERFKDKKFSRRQLQQSVDFACSRVEVFVVILVWSRY